MSNTELNDSFIRSNNDEEGVSRVQVQDGRAAVSSERVERWEESISADAKRRGGYDWQVTSQSGGVVAPGRGVKDTDLVKIPTGNGSYMETTVGVALRQGLISRDSSGSYVFDDGHLSQELASPKQEEQVKEPAREALADAGVENLIDTIAADVSPMTAIRVVHSLINDNQINPSLIGSMASELGVEPAQAQEYINKMSSAFTTQAESVVSKASGGLVYPDTLWAWARENDPKALKEAMSRQVKERSTAGYRQIAVNYLKQLDKVDPQKVFNAAHAAGIRPEWDNSRKVAVLHLSDGRSYSWRQCLELGIISLSAVK